MVCSGNPSGQKRRERQKLGAAGWSLYPSLQEMGYRGTDAETGQLTENHRIGQHS